MKTLRWLLLMALVVPGALMLAQDDAQFATWMKSVSDSSGVLRKLEKKTGPDAVHAAERLGGAYENMIGYWRQRGAADAVKLSQAGKAAAVTLASAANAGDAETAAAALGVLAGTCKTCHEAHRDKAGDKYTIK